MAENPPPTGRLRRFYQRLPADVRAALDPNLSTRARLLHGAKALALLGGFGLALLLVYGVVLIPFTPSIADLQRAKIDQPSVLISADGRRLATLKPMNREWVRLNQISPHVITALIATEDHRFYNHYGVDLLRVVSGILRTFIGDPQGGSTLTQQLARNLYPEGIGRQRTVTRKLKETITAIKIEFAYSKHRNPRNLSQYHAFFVQRLRHRNGCAHLLRQAGAKARCRRERDPDRHVKRHRLLQSGAQSRPLAQAPQRRVGANGQARRVERGRIQPAKTPPHTSRFRTPAGSPRPHPASCHADSQMVDRLGRPQRQEYLYRRLDRPHHHRLAFAGACQPSGKSPDGKPCKRSPTWSGA